MKNLFGENIKISEAEVLRDVQQYLRLKGVFHWRNNSGAYSDKESNRFIRFGFKGSSDIIAIYPGDKHGIGKGLIMAIECKRPGGRLSDAQIDFLRGVRQSGGVASVVESVSDLERVFIDMNQSMSERYEEALRLSTG